MVELYQLSSKLALQLLLISMLQICFLPLAIPSFDSEAVTRHKAFGLRVDLKVFLYSCSCRCRKMYLQYIFKLQ